MRKWRKYSALANGRSEIDRAVKCSSEQIGAHDGRVVDSS